MRAASGPLAIFLEGARRLIRAPLPLAALWLPQAIATYALETTPSTAFFDLDVWTDPRGAIGMALWFVLRSFLWGAILTRYAHPRTTGISAFLAGGGAFFGRMVRLALLTVVIFYGVDLLMTPDHMPEDEAMVLFRLADWWPLAAGLFLQLFIQLAEVRTIVEDRRSVLFALAAGWRLLAARPLTLLVMYAMAGFVLIVGLALMVPILGFSGPMDSNWGATLFSQSITAAILLFDLQISASLIALYQAEMARRRPEYDPAEASSGLSRLNELTAKE